MSDMPVPPSPAPESNRIDSVSPAAEKRSAYWGMGAQEAAAAYIKQVRLVKAQAIALVIASCAAMVWSVQSIHWVFYVLYFVALFAIVFISCVRITRLFIGLEELVSRDCNPTCYRAVLDALAARDRLGRSANAFAVELAYCDYLELDSASALRRLESVTFKRRDNPRWFRAMQIEFLSRVDLGDVDGARDSLARLSAFRQNFKEGSRNRALADDQVAGLAILLRPPHERDAADAAAMRERMLSAGCHQQRANWQLYLAEYELLHGSAEEAGHLASDVSLEPLTPRMERLRAEVLSGLEVSG